VALASSLFYRRPALAGQVDLRLSEQVAPGPRRVQSTYSHDPLLAPTLSRRLLEIPCETVTPFGLALGLAVLAAPAFAEPFELKDRRPRRPRRRHGHRTGAALRLLGGGLTSRWPDRNVTFRNLGWSGDNVWGDARAGFGTRADGFRLLKDHVLSLNPTVIVVAYGGNEAFDGEAALPKFVDGLNILLDTLSPARRALCYWRRCARKTSAGRCPTDAEKQEPAPLHRRPARRGQEAWLTFADMNDFLGDGPKAPPLTDDGLHLTGAGYWRAAFALEHSLDLPDRNWSIEIGAASKKAKTQGAKVENINTTPQATLSFQVVDAALPLAPPTEDAAARPTPAARVLKATELADGKFTLFIDGRPVVTRSNEEWGKGVTLSNTPEFGQANQLRQAIVAKNRLYFYRWRPANETYLFGFPQGRAGQKRRRNPGILTRWSSRKKKRSPNSAFPRPTPTS